MGGSAPRPPGPGQQRFCPHHHTQEPVASLVVAQDAGDRPTLAHLCLSPGVTMPFLPSAHWPGLVHSHTHRQRGGTYGDRRRARCAPGPLPRPAQTRREGLGRSPYSLVSLSSPVSERFPPQLWFNLQSPRSGPRELADAHWKRSRTALPGSQPLTVPPDGSTAQVAATRKARASQQVPSCPDP